MSGLKMKRLPFCVVCLIMIVALVGCGNNQSRSEQNTAENNLPESNLPSADVLASDPAAEASPDSSDDTQPETDGSRILVVYFSRTGEQYNVGVIEKGNTAIVAEMIAETTGADTFEIIPANDTYPTTYDALTEVAQQEQRESARPEIAGAMPDLSQYDTVFIGAPVWWGDWPMICYTYFEANDFSGKTLIPFSTHEGSGLSGFDKKLENAAPGATVLKGLAVRGSDAQNNQESVRSSVTGWLSELGF